jgi:hypothetical protein
MPSHCSNAMVETNPVHPDLRRQVRKALDDMTDAKIRPTGTERDGYVKLCDGQLHTVHLDDYEVAGTSLVDDGVLIHVDRV